MKLYVIGLGPGDEELVTIKASKALMRGRTIFIPYSTGTNRSLAENIVKKYAPTNARLVLLGFPMSKNIEDSELKKLGEKICEEASEESAFVTLGDPSLYSTFFRIKDKIPCKIEIEVIPGITSITACASKVQLSLANSDDSIAIIPASRLDKIEMAKNIFETIVILKTNENLEEIMNLLKDDFSLIYAKRCFMSEEKILSINEEKISDKDYFSMIIALKRR